VPARELARADVAYAAAAGLALTDVPRGTGFGVRALLLALRTGEPVRVCRALALVAMSTAYEGPRAERRALGLARAARELGERAGDARAVALAELAAASIPLLLGDWSDARARLARAERLLSARCRGAHWELASARAWLCNVLIFLGRLGEARRLALELSHEAAERGDRFARVHVIYPACVAHLVDDEPDAARRAADELSTAAAPGRFANAHWGALVAGVSIDRYVGDGGAAWRRVRGAWRALRRSLLLRVQMVRVFAHFERALCALAAADAGAPAEPLVRAAEADARRLAREGVPYARAMGRYALAGALAAQGRRAEAIAALRDAVDGCAAAGLGYFVACARERYGALRGGGEGDEASARARAFFAAEGVRSPARCLAMSAPGFRRLLGGAPGPGP
jgi:tetratricopeptide (TPR) repeat protein